MKSIKMAAIVALLAGSMALGASQITYTLEVGGDNSAALWEANGTPTFQSGVTTNGTTVALGDDLTWAVRVAVSGTHEGGAGNGEAPLGAANLVFDLLVTDEAGNPVAFGAAPISCTGGNPGDSTATACVPTDAGFHSTINDGDADGDRGFGGNADLYANGSFAIQLGAGANQRLIDANPGPNFDYGWYPTSVGKGGIPTSGGTPATTTTATGGELLGFGAGYKDYDFGVNYLAGVGVDGALGNWGSGECGQGFGSDLPLFEGQISTIGLDEGTYKIVLVPGAHGNNILQGSIDCIYEDFGGYGSFANEANATAVSNVDSAITFTIVEDKKPEVVGRYVFYNNSYFDGYDSGSDDNAIDTSKQALLPGDGASDFSNSTGYSKGLNGIMVDIANMDYATRALELADFTFTGKGTTGNSNVAVATPTSFIVRPGEGVNGSDRVVITWADATFPPPDGTVYDPATQAYAKGWLEISIGTGFGMEAEDLFWFANAVGNCNEVESNIYLVNTTDRLECRNNQRSIFIPAPVDFPYDFNKDRLVNATDRLISRSNATSLFTSVRVITR